MSLALEIGMATFTEYEEGVLGIAVDRFGGPEASGATLKCISPLGLLSRPEDPLVGPDGAGSIGANCLFGDEGGEGFAMPTNEPRWIEKIPELSKGATVLYSAGPFLLLDQENASTMLYQPVGDDAGQVFSMVGKPGECDIQIRHETGAGIAIQKDGKTVINNAAGDAYIEVGPDGIVLNGNVKINGGVVLGEIAAAQPLAKFPTMATALAAIGAALTAVGTALTTLGNAGAAGAITAAGTAISPAAAPGTGGTLMVSGT